MFTTWSHRASAHPLAFWAATSAKVRDERGGLNTAEILGLIIIVLGILAVVGPAVMGYIQNQLNQLR